MEIMESKKFDQGKPQLGMVPYELVKVWTNLNSSTMVEVRYAVEALSRLGNGLERNLVNLALKSSAVFIIRSFPDRDDGYKDALVATSRAMELGKVKYGRNNWQIGMQWSRLVDAAMRHLIAFLVGEVTDPESGADHRGHALFCVSALLHYLHNNLGVDDITIKENEGNEENDNA